MLLAAAQPSRLRARLVHKTWVHSSAILDGRQPDQLTPEHIHQLLET
jgi:hypothetical protein